MGGPASHIDALTIGITMEHGEVSTKSAEHLGTAGRRGAPAEIENDRDPRQALVLNAAQQAVAVMLQQLGAMVGSTAGTQRRSRFHVPLQAGLNPALQGSAKLAPVSAEHLDAVVFRRVMACGNHQTTCSLKATDQPRNGGRRAQSERPHVPSCRGEACRQGCHHHGPTAARIHPDEHGAVCRQHASTPEAHLQREGWRNGIADPTAQTIRAETDLRRRKGTERMGCRGGHEVSFVD